MKLRKPKGKENIFCFFPAAPCGVWDLIRSTQPAVGVWSLTTGLPGKSQGKYPESTKWGKEKVIMTADS